MMWMNEEKKWNQIQFSLITLIGIFHLLVVDSTVGGAVEEVTGSSSSLPATLLHSLLNDPSVDAIGSSPSWRRTQTSVITSRLQMA